MTFTPAEVDRWLEAAYKKGQNADFQQVYKSGWLDGVTAVMIEFDEARKRQSQQLKQEG